MPSLADFLHHLVQHAVPMLAGAAAAWLVACWPEKPPPFDPHVGGLVVRHGWAFRAFSLVCFLVLGGPALLFGYAFGLNIDRDPALALQPIAFLIAVPALIFALTIYLLAEAFRVRIDVTPVGVISRSAWRGRRAIRWVDVVEVTYSHAFDWLRIRGRDGQTIRAHYFLRGFPWLARAVLQHAPVESYERDDVVIERLAARAKAEV